MDLFGSISPFATAYADMSQNAVAPLADVSQSSPPMSGSTNTGTGTGEYISGDWGKFWQNTATGVLNYALNRDQQQIVANTQKDLSYNAAATQQAAVGYQAQAAQSNRMLLWGALAVGVVFVVMRK